MLNKFRENYSNIFVFDDVVDYLNQVISDNKSRYRLTLFHFAKSSGVGSAALVSQILNKKRKLSYQGAEKIIKALKLKGEKKKYFLLLHRLHASRTERERVEARENIFKHKAKPTPYKLKLEQYRFLANWYYPALYILAGLKSTSWDLQDLSEKLQNKVSPQKIKEALEDMVSLGLLVKVADEYTRGVQNPTTEEDFIHIAIFRYHEQMAEMAYEGLETALNQREYCGLTVAVPKSEMKTVKEKIRKFRRELNDYLDPLEKDAEDVYQLNVQLFPLTQLKEEKSHGSN
jgi:uncharacterized protein (TIGR02147 family)